MSQSHLSFRILVPYGHESTYSNVLSDAEVLAEKSKDDPVQIEILCHINKTMKIIKDLLIQH